MLPPLWVRNPKTKKYEYFPFGELEDFKDGLKGLDQTVWFASSEKGYEVLARFNQLFIKQYKSDHHNPCRYVFLPMLSWHKRLQLRCSLAAFWLFDAIPKVALLLIIPLIAVFLVFSVILGTVTILEYLFH
jgi:hypothetical protein